MTAVAAVATVLQVRLQSRLQSTAVATAVAVNAQGASQTHLQLGRGPGDYITWKHIICFVYSVIAMVMK